MVIGAFALSQTPINTGNSNLNNELPLFYDCIEDAVDNSLSSTEPNYFKEEPTRAEVRGCFEDTIGNTGQ